MTDTGQHIGPWGSISAACRAAWARSALAATRAGGEQRLLLITRELTELHRLEGLENGCRTLLESAYDALVEAAEQALT